MHRTFPMAFGLLLCALPLAGKVPVKKTGSSTPPGDAGATGPGIASTPERINGFLIEPGANLENADLRAANLAGRDLSRARLDNADCTGANFSGANLTGASLKGTRLFMADIRGATGLDLSGAQLHPFFESADEPEAVGDLRFYHTEGKGTPRFLVASPKGEVFWVEDSAMQRLSPTGVQYEVQMPEKEQKVKGLVKDRLDRLWVFGDKWSTWFHLADLSPGSRCVRRTFRDVHLGSGTEPVAITAGPRGDVLVSMPDRVHNFYIDNDLGMIWTEQFSKVSNLGPVGVATANADGMGVFLTGSKGTEIVFVEEDGGPEWTETGYSKEVDPRGFSIRMTPGCRVNRLVRGVGKTVWFTQEGSEEGIGSFEEGSNVVTFNPLPAGGGPRRPWDLALDASGAVWFTMRERASLGRLVPGESLAEIALPAGLRASELVQGPGGRMLFTVEGEGLIGSVVAVPKEEKKVAPGGGWEVATYVRPRPDRRKPLTDAERRKLHDARILAAEARYAARNESAPAPAPAPAGEMKEMKEMKEVKEAPVPDLPLDRLAALGVNLSRGAVRSILAKHGSRSTMDKSRFAPAYSTPAALAALIAEGMENSGVIGRVLISDAEGHFLTLCEKAGVGTCFGSEVPTGRFWVRTVRYFNGERFEHDVIGAYPTR